MAGTIILIDDDPDDLEMIKQAISAVDAGIVCISFIYPDEALRVLLTRELVVIPDLIFIDINMPGLTGDKCLRAIRKDRSFDRVFIAMYSTSMPDTVSEALRNLGANFAFEKPVRMARYSQIVGEIVKTVGNR